MAQTIIELRDLTKKYGSFTAVDNLTLDIIEGEVYGLLGPNGAGKTTAILMMLGLSEPTSGTVRVCGINSTKYPLDVKRKVGYLPEDIGFYDDYSGFENLVYTARLNSIPEKEARSKAMQLMDRVGLSDEKDKKTGKYSRGMRQRLGLADVLIKDPEVIILDEPTLGIDPKGVHDFLELIVKLSKEEGHTVLLSSHHLHQVQEICNRVGLFVIGKLIAEGDIKSLSRKLFPDEPIVFEAGMTMTSSGDVQPGTEGPSSGQLRDSIAKIEGVLNISLDNELLRVSCDRDLSREILMAIIRSGSGVSYMRKKEYGLNEIYNRYFEGVENNG